MSAAWWVVIAGLAVGGAFGLGLWVGSSLWWTLWKKWGEAIVEQMAALARRRNALLDPEDGGPMSDDLVERLRWECGQCSACDQVKRAAADRIEALEAERGTLAEIVAIISPRVERDAYGLGIVAGRNFYADSRWTEADGERFRAVLDRIYREAETDD